MGQVITGLYENPAKAAFAIDCLIAKGVPGDDISVIANDGVPTDAFTVETHSKLPEGAAIGAGAGGAVGALVAGFTAVGALVSGGAGVLATGPIVAALTGAGAGAAGGGVIGALAGYAFPEHEVKFYEDAIDNGAVLVGVQKKNSRDSMVRDCLGDCDAKKVSEA